MTSLYHDPDLRDLLFSLFRAPETEREAVLAAARQRRPEIAAAAEQAFAEVMVLLDRLPEDAAECRAALGAGRTLHPLLVEAVEWLRPEARALPPALAGLSPAGLQELLPPYSPERGPGTSFGYYLIERELARGGLGIVYIARDQRLPSQPRRALKILLHVNADNLTRFETEMAILDELAKESNVVGVKDYGRTPEPFLVMEYVENGSLAEALPSGAWPGPGQDRARAAAGLVRTLARTLQRVQNSAGIFHLDLKPANVLLHQERGPLLADFNLARRVREGDDCAGAVEGTLAYMAPEQAGRARHVNLARIDVYGLGAILYELLTGRTPLLWVEGDSPAAFLCRIQSEEPPPPSTLAPGVPPDLEAICVKCLCKNPEERYPSAEKLADDLDAFLRGDETSASRWPWHRRARHRARRHRVGIAVGLAIAMLLFTGVVLGGTTLWYRAQTAEEQAKRTDEENQHRRQQIRAAARAAAERGDWQLAMELYDSALRDHEPDDPQRLVLEVERLPGWFLYRSRQEVAAELDRLEQAPLLAARERATIQLYRGDLRLCEDGRTPAVLALLRESRDSGILDKADALYAEALLAPTSREALARLRELVERHPGHYRGRAALLGLLLVRGELDELRERLRLHQDRFPGDPTAALLEAQLDILQKDDLPAALARIDRARERLGEERWQRSRAFLAEWARLLRAVAHDDIPKLDLLRLKTLTGGDKDVFSLNVPTICWLWEHWGAAAKAFVSSLGLFLAPDAVLEKWRTLCEDNPEATFVVNRVVAELAVGQRLEKAGRKDQGLEHYGRAVELCYQAADARAPTLVPRSEWRYKALCMAVLTDAAYLATRGQPAEPARDERLRDALRRVVTEGRPFRDFRAQNLPRVIAELSGLVRNYPQALPPDLAERLLIEWMQDEADNPVPYRLRAKQALDLDQPAAAWAVVAQWYANKRHPKDAQLDELDRKAKDALGRLFRPSRGG